MIPVHELRAALGSFATGVTIVTTALQPDQPVGVTASSFNSVSLDPPLVLWSLAKSSRSLNAFCASGHFAIHVLSCEQEDLSNHFARSGEDKFQDVDWDTGILGSPVLQEYSAKFECKTVHQYEGGDHIIFVGQVMNFDHHDLAPLLFHGGQYAESRPRASGETVSGDEMEQGRFTEDFFLYLLSRAHFQTSSLTWQKLAELELDQVEYYTISTAAVHGRVTLDHLQSALQHTGHALDEPKLDAMVQRNLLILEDGAYTASDLARDHFLELLSVAKAYEDDLLEHFSASEIAEGKRILKKIIRLTGEAIPPLLSRQEPE
jgi:3-hydroxy-9,10-secoandrosta-1,3,5(10)-triene-9,17-dione monooxygenase reductase component